MKLHIVIEGPEKDVNHFAGEVIRNSPPSIEVLFDEIKIEKDAPTQHTNTGDDNAEQ